MAQPPIWSPAEIDFLSELGDSLPIDMLALKFRRRAKARGWPIRTKSAIRTKLVKLKISTRTNSPLRLDDYTSTGGAAMILGCSKFRVARILDKPRNAEIAQMVRSGRLRYVNPEGWRRLARERPEVFRGLDPDRLFQLLEDRDLAEDIAARFPLPYREHPIRCIETGRVWLSARKAAADLFVHPTSIFCAIKQQRPVRVLGMSFEWVRGAA